jgi:hypothetical protein
MKPSFLRAASTEWQPRQIRYLWKEELSADRVRNVLPQTVIAMWRALPMQCKCGAEQRRRRESSSCVVMIGSQAPLFSSYSVCRASASASSTQSSGRPRGVSRVNSFMLLASLLFRASGRCRSCGP